MSGSAATKLRSIHTGATSPRLVSYAAEKRVSSFSSDSLLFGRTLSTAAAATERVSDLGGAIIPNKLDPTKEIHLPPPEEPVGAQLYQKAVYCPASRTLRTSGHIGTDHENRPARGRIGTDATPEEANVHARNAGLRLLSTIHHYLDGDLSRVEQVLHVEGQVNAPSDFTGHAQVVNGCSQVLAEAFGKPKGIGTRACYGVGSLGATVSCHVQLQISDPS